MTHDASCPAPTQDRPQLDRQPASAAGYRPPTVVRLGSAAALTRGGPDGQWLDGNTGTNPNRFKK